MAKRSKAKSYRIVGNINYRGVSVGPGEEIPSKMSQVDIRRQIERGKIREVDPQTGLNIEPKHRSDVELSKDQVGSFFSKPSGYIAKHLATTNFSIETLAKMQVHAERRGAPKQVIAHIERAMERQTRPS